MGRGLNPIWAYYKRSSTMGKKGIVYIGHCNFCGTEVCGQTRSLRSHVATCSKLKTAKAIADKAAADEALERDMSDLNMDNERKEESGALPVARLGKPKNQSMMNYLVMPLGEERTKKLDALVSKWIIVRDHAFLTVNERELLAIIDHINPSIKMIDNETVAEKWLPYWKDETLLAVTKHIRGQFITVTIDGSEDACNDPIVNIVGICGDHVKPFFWKAVNLGTNRHSAEKYAEVLLAEVAVIKETTDAVVVASITDNCSAMRLYGTIIQTHMIIDQGGPCHALQLGMKWVGSSPEMEDTIKEIVELQKCIKKTRIKQFIKEEKFGVEAALNKRLGVPMIGETRWGTHLTVIKWQEMHKALLKAVAINEAAKTFVTAVYKKVLSDEYWERLAGIRRLIQPLDEAIRRCESDSLNPSMCLHIWDGIYPILETAEMKEEFTKEYIEAYCKRLDDVWKYVCREDMHYLVYMLDARVNRRRPLTKKYLKKGIAWGKAYTERLGDDELVWKVMKPQIVSFNLRNGEFSDSMYDVEFDGGDPKAPFLLLLDDNEFGALAKFALRLLSIKSSDAVVERSFSSLNNTHTKKRNRLLPEHTEMCVFVKNNKDLL